MLYRGMDRAQLDAVGESAFIASDRAIWNMLSVICPLG